MTIQEAIKSGKKIKRSAWTYALNAYELCYGAEDILATDWDTEEIAVPVTRSQFFQAVADIMKEAGMEYYIPFGKGNPEARAIVDFKHWNELANKLGLK